MVQEIHSKGKAFKEHAQKNPTISTLLNFKIRNEILKRKFLNYQLVLLLLKMSRMYLKLDSVTRSNQNQIFRTAVGTAELPAPRVIVIWNEIKIFQHQLRVFKFSLNIIIDDCHVCSS